MPRLRIQIMLLYHTLRIFTSKRIVFGIFSHTASMKKFIVLLAAITALGAVGFAGCAQNGDGTTQTPMTRITAPEQEESPSENRPHRGMPKFRPDFRSGHPVRIGGEGGRKVHGNGKLAPRPPERTKPAPAKEGGEDTQNDNDCPDEQPGCGD